MNEIANPLGAYLKDRRARLDPAVFGFPARRRRTPGLRREEVAQRANISPTWYTWLEQGRGGAPSTDVLDRIASALLLTDVEREHLFLIGLGHPPEVHYRGDESATPRLQRILDALEPCPALIRTAIWDVVAWNRAMAVLTDYGALPPGQRNILRWIFLDPRAREAQYDWDSVARSVLGTFRVDVARAGASREVTAIVDELLQTSPEFEAMWQDNEIATHVGGTKHIRHPLLGSIAIEMTTLAVDGRTDLSMTIYNPVEATVKDRIAALIESGVTAETRARVDA
jgi:transcriptional regulator with XRE-family HTH domain